jgi:putative glycerol-1-phosphate prenyltransferase
MTTIYKSILKAKNSGNKLLAILLDPEKINIENLALIAAKISQSPATHIFIGGSSNQSLQTDKIVSSLKKHTQLPLVLFPGNPSQITNKADAILYLSLISGRNPDYLIEHQVAAVPQLKASNLEVISTSYIIIDSGTETMVTKISQTKPLNSNDINYIVQTAQAGEYLGHKLIYLEAGSGANKKVSENTVNLVSKNTTIPLLVGGGICNLQEIQSVYNAGADMIVIGTAFENNLNFFNS